MVRLEKTARNSALVRMVRNVRTWMVPAFVIKVGRGPIVRNGYVHLGFMEKLARIVVSAMKRIPKCKFDMCAKRGAYNVGE